LLHQHCCHGLKCHPKKDVLPITYSALNATTVISAGVNLAIIRSKNIVNLASLAFGKMKTLAYFEAFYRINAQHGITQTGMKLIKFGFANANRTAFNHTSYHATHGVALGFNIQNQLFHAFSRSLIRASHRVGLYILQIIKSIIVLQSDVANLRDIGRNAYPYLL